jgi:outer membrane receptor protein involved in Fe transport
MLSALILALSLVQGSVTGVVKDTSGGTVSQATIVVRTGSTVTEQTVTGPDGTFTVAAAPGSTLVVRAGGFAERELRFPDGGSIEIVLSPAGVLETLTVTPARTEQQLGNAAASVTVLDREDIRRSPALVADDVLRRIPTFSLFRRTSSIAAHPTTQGVSLRGIGPSGVSRSLVLLDGVPFNDPFGGWVYWTRLPMESANRIEVVDGSSSSLYGNYAMGGVINVVSARPSAATLEARAQYGNLSTPKVELFGSHVVDRFGVTVDGGALETDGYAPVVAAERGLADMTPDGEPGRANVGFSNINAKVDYRAADDVSLFVRGGYFREERNNAKFSTFNGDPEANDTTHKSLNGGVRMILPDQSDLQARVFYDDVSFFSSFLAVPNLETRAIGRMSLLQTVPTKSLGGTVQWSRALFDRHHFTAGADWKWVDGDSNEDVLDFDRGERVVTERVSGGAQRSAGAFVQDIFTPAASLSVTLSARLDHWRSYDGHNLETSVVTGLPTVNNRPTLPEKTDTVVSPRAAARYLLTDEVSIWGDLGWGFRTPTLNELYRQFRVGNILTLPNNQLGPERLVGGELGVNIAPTRDVTIRGTFYDNRISNPVSNVTRTDLTNTLQRQNLGRTRVWGIQTNVEYTVGSLWTFSGGYLFNQAKVKEYDADPTLVGNYLVQVPKHRGTVQAVYANRRFASIAASMQFVGRQFDDDENIVRVPGETEPGLPGFVVFDLTASRSLGRNLEAFVGLQNLFDEEYFVGTRPTTIGSPRLFHGGVRVRLAGL